MIVRTAYCVSALLISNTIAIGQFFESPLPVRLTQWLLGHGAPGTLWVRVPGLPFDTLRTGGSMVLSKFSFCGLRSQSANRKTKVKDKVPLCRRLKSIANGTA